MATGLRHFNGTAVEFNLLRNTSFIVLKVLLATNYEKKLMYVVTITLKKARLKK